MKMKLLINPFERIAGWQALAIGVVVMALTAVFGQINNIAFDGALDVHAGASISLSQSFIMQAVDLFALFLTLWLAGICFSKSKLRAIDVAGTIALARTPMLFLVIVCFLPIVPKGLFDMPRTIVFAFICIPFYIWMITLMYNAYTVSCHLKGRLATVSFIGALVAAEIITFIIFFFFSGSLLSTSGNAQHNVIEITAPAESTSNHETAKIVIEAFNKSDVKTVCSYFDEKMKNSLSEKELNNGWTNLTLQFGKFISANINVEVKQNETYELFVIPCTFEGGMINLNLTFNREGRIAGIYFLPNKL